MAVVTRGGYSPAGLAVVLVLHAVLLYFVLIERTGTRNISATRSSQLLFIVTPPPKTAVKVLEPPRMPVLNPPSEKTVAIAPRVEMKAPLPEAAPPAPVVRDDPFQEITHIDIGTLVKQAGKADRETRSGREMEKYGPTTESMEAVMSRAFDAAKLAVPLKWYEAARIELLSAPNDPKPIYQVKTAFGTYCLYYPDKLREGTGQPRMAGCPHVSK